MRAINQLAPGTRLGPCVIAYAHYDKNPFNPDQSLPWKKQGGHITIYSVEAAVVEVGRDLDYDSLRYEINFNASLVTYAYQEPRDHGPHPLDPELSSREGALYLPLSSRSLNPYTGCDGSRFLVSKLPETGYRSMWAREYTDGLFETDRTDLNRVMPEAELPEYLSEALPMIAVHSDDIRYYTQLICRAVADGPAKAQKEAEQAEHDRETRRLRFRY